jgi:hypothetical protein
MNSHKKLRELGFKKTKFHKPGYDSETCESCMLLDEYEIKWETIGGKRVKVENKKIHPKGDSFWTLKYSENYILWCLVKNHQINKIWLEDKNKVSNDVYWKRNKKDERLQLVFDYNIRESSPLQGKNQIMNLLPKEIKRDFLLDQLFGF